MKRAAVKSPTVTVVPPKSNKTTKLEEFMITPQAQQLRMTGVKTTTVVRLPVNKNVDAATVHSGDQRWQVAQQVYADAGHYEWDNLPNWTALRQKASEELNKLLSSCGDTQSALTTLNSDLNSVLRQQGVG